SSPDLHAAYEKAAEEFEEMDAIAMSVELKRLQSVLETLMGEQAPAVTYFPNKAGSRVVLVSEPEDYPAKLLENFFDDVKALGTLSGISVNEQDNILRYASTAALKALNEKIIAYYEITFDEDEN